MKLAVCEKLSELIVAVKAPCTWRKNGEPIHWPTEGLQVCHEAEKLLTPETRPLWLCEIANVALRNRAGLYPVDENYLTHHADQEQRLEALCRVWFPERFAD